SSKRRAADALQISAVRIQLAGPRGKVVREQNEAFGIQRTGHVDLLNSRLGRYAIRADTSPYSTLRGMGRSCRNFNLFLKNRRVGCVRHRTGHVENSHLQPPSPVLKATRVCVFIVSEDGG